MMAPRNKPRFVKPRADKPTPYTPDPKDKRIAELEKEVEALRESVRAGASDLAMALIPAPGYEQLVDVLRAAHDQAALGKGKERHANDLPFGAQPMQTISFLLHSSDGMLYQAIKKVQEARQNLDSTRKAGGAVADAKRFYDREILGAINYLAGAIIFERCR